ncbi:C2H2 finger domain protein, putative [Talaromyces stipitatus ATCC 10500]|uniref:C2H2 finger domain protein, putative n=1 Tax=Talaromyces stipitatus (strain ATCC 10500 / CBS 375.48 / QM 6759 / NRRL 1006) TaxID=441959 RepID=B8LV64_TALSN|nr:C2H2 finger domain protein, putative [Talaromyces stipitatus ATCC 10500]EED23114.1 C2H2 finger domain protein, putative [Talaromyces stipitatus ATCC 10500]
MGDSLPYTCNACLVAFRTSDAQREHMRRDWHLYNVKRRVASLPPVSQEVFTEKVLTARVTTSAAAAKASFEKTCEACQKSFYSENSYQNHLQSSKHKLREKALKKKGGLADDTSSVMSSTFSLGDPINKSVAGDNESTVSNVTEKLKNTAIKEAENEDEDMEEKDEEEKTEEYSSTKCLFCTEEAGDLQANVEHMFKVHGMFIPEKDYLADLDGLIRYLHAKISENHECLLCHAIRTTAAGIRTHMRDKSHCMIAFETEEEQVEIGQFYDFRSTYSDDEEEDEDITDDAGGVPITSSDADEAGWETDDSSVDSDPQQKPFRGSQPIYQTDYELHLPSGRSVGHRSLAKYYRQNLHSYPSLEERAAARQLAIENGTADKDGEGETTTIKRNEHKAIISRANGGLGLVGASAQQRTEALEIERRERTRAQREERKITAKVNRQANSQKHFRDPLLQ